MKKTDETINYQELNYVKKTKFNETSMQKAQDNGFVGEYILI